MELQGVLPRCSKWLGDGAADPAADGSNHRRALPQLVQSPTDAGSERPSLPAPVRHRGSCPTEAVTISCLCGRACWLLHRLSAHQRWSRSAHRVWVYWKYGGEPITETLPMMRKSSLSQCDICMLWNLKTSVDIFFPPTTDICIIRLLTNIPVFELEI